MRLDTARVRVEEAGGWAVWVRATPRFTHPRAPAEQHPALQQGISAIFCPGALVLIS